MNNVHFLHPIWLGLGALGCLAIIALLARAARLRRAALRTFAGARFVTTVSRRRRLVKQALVIIGVAATFVALARPVAGFRWEEERQEGIDLMFAVDTSKSMLTTDLRPDRLARAKLAVSDLLREFPGERAGLIAFAGDAFVQAPMTVDHDVFAEALDALDTSIIARGGTNIAAPIRAAVQALATEPERRKVLVLLSDGEDLQGEALAAARDAARSGLVIYTVGVGTPAGDLVPVERDGVRDVMRDAEGRAVHSRLDEQMLRKLAEATGGAYAALGPSGRGLETLYRDHLAQLPRHAVAERMHKVYTERFQIPLAVAIACLLAELALGERRRRRSAGYAPALALALVVAAARPASAAERPGSKPGGAGVSTYNAGTEAYRKKDFGAAQGRFQDATHTTDIAMQGDAYYDLGNARYRLGQAALSKDRPAAIEAWKSAVAAYDGALALQPKDVDARFNRDLVSRRLAALEDQQRQEQKQEDQAPKAQQNPKGQQKQSGGQSGRNEQKDRPGQQGQKGAEQPSQSSAGNSPNNRPNGEQRNPGKGDAQGQAGQGPQKQPAAGSAAQSAQPQGGPESGGSPPQPAPRSESSAATAPPAEPESPPRQGPGVVSGPAGERDSKAPPPGARRNPGALSANEAAQLLDSVAGELRRMPVAGQRRQPANADDLPIKDW